MLSRTRITIAAICIAYVAVRLWRLDASCLWFDEIFSIHAAEHDWGSMFSFVGQDLIHPPLFYLLLKGWLAIFGDGLFWIRLFPVFFSALALFPFLHLCKELKLDASTRIFALVLLAANGALIKYAQEVRMYAPLLFFSLVSLWLFARFYYRGKNIWILTLVNVLLVYTHYFGWFVILTELVVIAVFQRVKVRHVLTMLGIAAVAFAPWIFVVVKAAFAGADVKQNIGWMSRPGFRELFDFGFDLIEPIYHQQSSIDPGTIVYVTLPLLLVLAVASLWYFSDWKNQAHRAGFYPLSAFVLIPLFLAFAFSWLLPVSIWGLRHLIIVFSPVSILLAMMVTQMRPKILSHVAIGLVGLVICVAFIRAVTITPTEQIWCAWENLATRIPSEGEQSVYTFEDLTAYHAWFATRRRDDVRIYKVNGVEGMNEDKAYFLPRGFDQVASTDRFEGNRFWILFRDQRWDERHPPVSDLLVQGYVVKRKEEFRTSGGTGFLVEVAK